MANKFRGTTWNNARFGPKIQIRRSIDLAELGDFGDITENSSDLPTSGATHRKATGGSTSATRGYTDLQGLFDTVVDTQDMGAIADITTPHRIWSSTGAITDVVTSAPTGILPGTGSSSSSSASRDFSSASLLYTMHNPNPSSNEFYGSSVSLNDTYLASGSPKENTNGAVYIHKLSDGSLEYTISNPSTNVSINGTDWFGHSLTMNNAYLLIGSPYEDHGTTSSASNSGAAYVYDTSDMSLSYTLTSNSPARDDYFAARNALAISDTYAVVGAYGADSAGAVFIYDLSDGSILQKLNGSSTGDDFGSSVAISGSYIIVGAKSANKAYVYHKSESDSSFSLEYTFNNPNTNTANSSDGFGTAVGISDTYAVVGAPKEDVGQQNSGSAHVYDLSDGTFLYTLDNPDADSTTSHKNFGIRLDVDGNYAVFGTEYPTGTGGSIHIFELSDGSGSLVKTIDNPNGQGTSGGDQFGGAVAINSGHIAVGALEEDYILELYASNSGIVYVFEE